MRCETQPTVDSFSGRSESAWSRSSFRETKFARKSAACAPIWSRRAEILAESLGEIVEPAVERGSHTQLRRIVDRFENRQRLAGVIVYDAAGKILAESSSLSDRITPAARAALRPLTAQGNGVSEFLTLGDQPMNAYYLGMYDDNGETPGRFSRSFTTRATSRRKASASGARRCGTWWRRCSSSCCVTVLIIRWTIVLPISRTAQWMKDLRGGRVRPSSPAAE